MFKNISSDFNKHKNMLKDMEIDKIYKRIFINAPTNCAMLLGTEKKS